MPSEQRFLQEKLGAGEAVAGFAWNSVPRLFPWARGESAAGSGRALGVQVLGIAVWVTAVSVWWLEEGAGELLVTSSQHAHPGPQHAHSGLSSQLQWPCANLAQGADQGTHQLL